MKRLLVLVACAAVLATSGVSDGGGGGGHGSGGHGSGSSHVDGYTRKDGTHVAPYDRRLPGEGTDSSHSSLGHGSGSVHVPGHTEPHSNGLGVSSAHTSAPGARDSHGRLVRSETAKREFMRDTGYPHGRPGYVVDHIVPLKRGGCDCPANMQWQTVAEAKAKDRWE